MRVEPADQPVPDLLSAHARSDDAGVRQAALDTLADGFQICRRVLSANLRIRLADPAVDHHPHAPLLSSPGQFADGGVDEQSARLRNALQVMLHERQVHLAEGRSSRSRMDVLPQLLLEIVPADLVLGVELDDPGRGFVLVEGVLQGFFQCVPGVLHPIGIAALGAQGHQLEERGARTPIFQEHHLLVGQVLSPGQQVDERWVVIVEA
ncbi:hypothetical protein PSA77_03302 [Pseudomonas aeruginosa]|nr:hypothetical protein PSA77_03302 [Pseudomonas aeruginosa]